MVEFEKALPGCLPHGAVVGMLELGEQAQRGGREVHGIGGWVTGGTGAVVRFPQCIPCEVSAGDSDSMEIEGPEEDSVTKSSKKSRSSLDEKNGQVTLFGGV